MHKKRTSLTIKQIKLRENEGKFQEHNCNAEILSCIYFYFHLCSYIHFMFNYKTWFIIQQSAKPDTVLNPFSIDWLTERSWPSWGPVCLTSFSHIFLTFSEKWSLFLWLFWFTFRDLVQSKVNIGKLSSC